MSGFTLPANGSYPADLLRLGRRRDAKDYAVRALRLPPEGTLTVYHQTPMAWAKRGARTQIDTHRSSSGTLGPGFYASTEPAEWYGFERLKLGIPVAALEGQRLLDLPSGTVEALFDGSSLFDRPLPGVDILATPGPRRQLQDRATWFVFTPRTGDWLNSVATEAQF